MAERQLPGIVFIMRSSGGAGRELLKSLNSDEQVKSLQDRFVLILTSEKDEPEGEKWNPGRWNDGFDSQIPKASTIRVSSLSTRI